MKAKKIVALCMAAAMTLSLAACGSTPADNGSTEPESSTQSTPADTGSSEETSSEAGNDSEESVEPTESVADVDLSDIIPTETVTLDVYDQDRKSVV